MIKERNVLSRKIKNFQRKTTDAVEFSSLRHLRMSAIALENEHPLLTHLNTKRENSVLISIRPEAFSFPFLKEKIKIALLSIVSF